MGSFTVSRFKYAKAPALPPIKRERVSPPFARRCPSGEYEVMSEGLRIAGGFDNFEEAQDWIKENAK